MSINIATILSRTAENHPHKPFLRLESGNYSFVQVDTQAQRIAEILKRNNVRAGHVVALILQNSMAFVSAYFGILKTGAVAAPIIWTSPGPEIAIKLKEMEATAIIASGRIAPAVVEGTSQFQCGVLLWADPPVTNSPMPGRLLNTESVEVSTACYTDYNTSGDDLATLLCTSGTTGRPKAVQLTHDNLYSCTRIHAREVWRLQENDVLLMAAPNHTIFGLAILLSALLSKASVCLLAKVTPQSLVYALEKYGITFFAGVPMMAQMMLKAAQSKELKLPELRRVLLSGTAMPPGLAAAFEQQFEAEVMGGYGMTEAAPITARMRDQGAPSGSVGKPVTSTELRIVNEEGKPLAAGEKGQILVKGPQVSPGYYRSVDLNVQTHANGWFHTGDIGYLDKNGYLFLVGRLKEIIKTAGNTVYPAEVETVLSRHPAVVESAVIGHPHPRIGEVVQAYVVINPDRAATLTPQDLITYCKKQLSSYKAPRRILFREKLPQTPSGKIRKQDLR